MSSVFHYFDRLCFRVAEGEIGTELPETYLITEEPYDTEEYITEAVCHRNGWKFWRFEGVIEHYRRETRMIGWLFRLDDCKHVIDERVYERMFAEIEYTPFPRY